jgi:hypothetical protein
MQAASICSLSNESSVRGVVMDSEWDRAKATGHGTAKSSSFFSTMGLNSSIHPLDRMNERGSFGYPREYYSHSFHNGGPDRDIRTIADAHGPAFSSPRLQGQSRYYCNKRYTFVHGCKCGRCDGWCGPGNGCACNECEAMMKDKEVELDFKLLLARSTKMKIQALLNSL